jgi:hypothetical protein
LIYQHVYSPVPVLPGKLAGYQEIINKTMAKHPAERYQMAAELIRALEAVA